MCIERKMDEERCLSPRAIERGLVQLEGELEVRLAEFSKLVAATGTSGSSTAELGGVIAALEGQLASLTDVNERLATTASAEPLAGAAALQQEHTLARHRDILKEFTAEVSARGGEAGCVL